MISLEQINARSLGCLPGLIGIEFTSFESGQLKSRLVISRELAALNGYLHVVAVIALEDTTCCYGVFYDLPEVMQSFMMIDLKCNSRILPEKAITKLTGYGISKMIAKGNIGLKDR